jgi:hypothetical protein
MTYEYNKKCFTFGKIKRIYFSKYNYYVELTNKNVIHLNDIDILEFHYNADIKALNEAFSANALEDAVRFCNIYD